MEQLSKSLLIGLDNMRPDESLVPNKAIEGIHNSMYNLDLVTDSLFELVKHDLRENRLPGADNMLLRKVKLQQCTPQYFRM